MSFIKKIEGALREGWNGDALTDYQGVTLQYNDVARRIAKHHILFQAAGIVVGDRIAICGRNSASWAVAFLATITYRAVAVPILHEFKPDNIHTIVEHSGARLLFVDGGVWENLNDQAMPTLEGVVNLNTFTQLQCRVGTDNLPTALPFDSLNRLFGARYPHKFRADSVHYEAEQSPDELALINYTSGTTGFSKGVMIPYRSLSGNVDYLTRMIALRPGDSIVSMLPLGHVFGMTFDFLYGITAQAHIYFLTRLPSPKLILEAFPQIQPRVISTVPLIVEKIIKKFILPRVDNPLGKLLLHTPILNDSLKRHILQEAMKAFGGNFEEIIIGGAPFNGEIETFLKQIGFPYTVAYGMTECGPIICSARWEDLKLGSCGRAADGMEIRIDSPNPFTQPGELLCRGRNLMLGYYKDPAATAMAINAEGWLRTGDIALRDARGNITIKGRSKNMFLTASGQNIYPEEIEATLNNMPYVAESLITMNTGKLTALIVPDYEEAATQNLTDQDIQQLMEENRIALNTALPRYAQIAHVRILAEEFEKTAKRSIKRFMYH